MVEAFDVSQPSAFESFLRFVGRPGFAVRNLLKGNVGGAARQIGEIPLDLLDAIIPGDVIPQITSKEDYPEFSDVIGGMDPGIAKTAVDIAGGIATDPLTFLGGPIVKGVSGVVASGAKQVAKAAPSVAAGANVAKRFTQRTAGAVPVDPAYADILSKANSVKQASSTANISAVKDMFTGVPVEDQRIMFQVLQNVTREGGLSKAGGKATQILPESPITAPYQAEELAKAMAGQQPKSVATMRANKLIEDVVETKHDPITQMHGVVDTTQELVKGVKLPNVIDSVSTLEGGAIPAAERVAASEAPELFNRWKNIADQKQVLRDRMAAMGVPVEQAERIGQNLDKMVEHTSGQFRELVEKGTYANPIGRDLLSESPIYAQRAFSGLEDEASQSILTKIGSPQASKQRTLKDAEELADFLNKNPEAKLEDQLALVVAKRGQQQAEMLGRTTVAKGLVDKFAKSAEDKIRLVRESQDPKYAGWHAMKSSSDKYKMAGLTEGEIAAYEAKGMPLFRPGEKASDLAGAANKIIDEIKAVDPDTAYALENIYRGVAQRGALMDVIAKGNAIFKPYATAGAFIPKISFNVRNVVSGLGQVLSNPQARQAWPQYAKGMANDILGAIDDGIEHLTGKRIGANEFDEVNKAFAASGGRIDDVITNIKNPRMREMVENGVITGGFVNSEQLVDTIARTGWSKKWRDIRDWPASIARGSEMRMRASTYSALRDKGMSPQEAAKIVQDTFFDYSIAGVENRSARDVIPFFQFTAKAVPQSAKLMKEQPWVMAGVRPLFSQGEDRPVYPYMQRGINVPLGSDDQGQQQYLTSLGMPIESLTQIPNPSGSPFDLLKDLRTGVVSQATPPLKTLFAGLSGVDPFFGTPFASYGKPPAALEALGVPEGDLARAYNVAAGTGLMQPITSPIGSVSQMVKDEGPAATTLNMLTGAKVRSVDEALALQQLLEQELRTRPDVQQYTTLFKRSADPETKAMLDQLKEIKKQTKKRKEKE